jgi:hypothetical protein
LYSMPSESSSDSMTQTPWRDAAVKMAPLSS